MDSFYFFKSSAGIGRSGTFCLVDCCLVLVSQHIELYLFKLIYENPQHDKDNQFSVQEVLLELRKYRMGLIQTYDQLKFSYEAIIEGMKRMNNDVSFLSSFHVIIMMNPNLFSTLV